MQLSLVRLACPRQNRGGPINTGMRQPRLCRRYQPPGNFHASGSRKGPDRKRQLVRPGQNQTPVGEFLRAGQIQKRRQQGALFHVAGRHQLGNLEQPNGGRLRLRRLGIDVGDDAVGSAEINADDVAGGCHRRGLFNLDFGGGNNARVVSCRLVRQRDPAGPPAGVPQRSTERGLAADVAGQTNG